MSNNSPTLLPGNTANNVAASASNVPTALPPATATVSGGKCGCNGSAAVSSASSVLVGASSSSQAPSLRPDSSNASAVTATWQSNVHINGLWSINQDRNAWVYLDNVGWRKLSGASESGLVAMNMLAAHAYQLGSSSSLYEGDDGSINQLYVW
jgi:hypothetical protein